jgi:ion channel
VAKINLARQRAGFERAHMLQQLVAGGAVSLINIAVHALTTTILIGSLRHLSRYVGGARLRLHLTWAMMMAAGLLMLAHCAEIGAWAAFYSWAEVTPPDGDSLYFAFVNYTTLGYGDLVPVARWRLIGPITAMNGILLFGWSTALLFAALQKVMIQLRITGPDVR